MSSVKGSVTVAIKIRMRLFHNFPQVLRDEIGHWPSCCWNSQVKGCQFVFSPQEEGSRRGRLIQTEFLVGRTYREVAVFQITLLPATGAAFNVLQKCSLRMHNNPMSSLVLIS